MLRPLLHVCQYLSYAVVVKEMLPLRLLFAPTQPDLTVCFAICLRTSTLFLVKRPGTGVVVQALSAVPLNRTRLNEIVFVVAGVEVL